MRVRVYPDRRALITKRRRSLINDSAFPMFITTTIVRWLPVFSDSAIAEEVLDQFERLREQLQLKIKAFCLMPSHLHAITVSANMGDISILMRKWKSLSSKAIGNYSRAHRPEWIIQFEDNAQQYNVRQDQKYQVWTPRFDDFAIRDDKQYEIKFNYIHSNPVRAGLVEKCEDYPYSSFRDYLGRKNGYIRIDCGQSQ